MFSSVGKNSVEKYHILLRKDEKINGKLQKRDFDNTFGQEDDNLSNITDEKDEKDLLANCKFNGKQIKLMKVELRNRKKEQSVKLISNFRVININPVLSQGKF